MYLLKCDAVVRNNGEHLCQQVLDLWGDVGRGAVHPLDDLLAQLLQRNKQHVSIRCLTHEPTSKRERLDTRCCMLHECKLLQG